MYSHNIILDSYLKLCHSRKRSIGVERKDVHCTKVKNKTKWKYQVRADRVIQRLFLKKQQIHTHMHIWYACLYEHKRHIDLCLYAYQRHIMYIYVCVSMKACGVYVHAHKKDLIHMHVHIHMKEPSDVHVFAYVSKT